ncbi:cytochrome P450 [Mycobacterium sp. 236(2023)]|uniref:cytochrome P450 n=1 Tax=Mycobacterium sp. 236(2023) TaxID=3038163 RepID=UPI002414F922|nr:cytochrome P450 [Mycobacterium sp. 236(2023)]MDG4668171.1 cytochrome P450 [Mycobacterium sp. 236(2023)]
MSHVDGDSLETMSFDDAVSGDVRDPYTELAAQRQANPIQRIDMPGLTIDESAPMFMVYRHEEIAQMLRDGETFSSAGVIAAFGEVLGQRVMLGMDEPYHGRLRSLVSKAFSQKALKRWEDELVTSIANDLIDRFVDRGRADLVKEFTFDYPTRIISGLLGLPEADFLQFQRWSIDVLSFMVAPDRGRTAAAALTEYAGPILAARRADPRDDLMSSLAAAEIDGERLTDDEIFSFMRLLLPAGIETTYRALGNMLFGLLSNPDQLAALRSDRTLMPQAIEEAVRWEAPLLAITRVATRDTTLGGVPIPQGAQLMPMLGAANRQEDRHERPDTFDILRQARAHIGFGSGPHVCLGMHLARLEMRTAVNLLMDRLPNLRLDPDGDDPHIRGQIFRSPTSLPVLFDAARG